MSTVTVITTPDLIELNRKAVKANRNRSFVDSIEQLLDPEGIHIVTWSMVHNDVEIRVRLLMKFGGDESPHEGYLDMSFEDFNGLATIEHEVDAT